VRGIRFRRTECGTQGHAEPQLAALVAMVALVVAITWPSIFDSVASQRPCRAFSASAVLGNTSRFLARSTAGAEFNSAVK
jgi:hypothetical protein